jgi:RNA polymerase sigma-32 factor
MSITITDNIQVKNTDSILSKYIKEVNNIKPFDKETELLLATEFAKTGNIDIANQLIKSQLKNVVRISFAYKNYGISMMDVIAEGNAGLIHAIKKFNPESGFRLSTYASWWVKAYINDFILQSWSLVKIGTTSLQKRIFFNLAKIKKRLGLSAEMSLNGQNAKLAAEYVGSTVEEFAEIDIRVSSPDISLNKAISSDGDSIEFGDTIQSDLKNPEELAIITDEKTTRIALLNNAIATLDEREKIIFCGRNLAEPKLTLDDLSIKFNLSKERIRQIEEKCFDKIKRYTLGLK